MSYFRAENLSLHFGGLKAVDAVSFAVEKGEILSIIGPNGAGKSSWSGGTGTPPPGSGRSCCSCRVCAPTRRLIAAASSR